MVDNRANMDIILICMPFCRKGYHKFRADNIFGEKALLVRTLCNKRTKHTQTPQNVDFGLTWSLLRLFLLPGGPPPPTQHPEPPATPEHPSSTLRAPSSTFEHPSSTFEHLRAPSSTLRAPSSTLRAPFEHLRAPPPKTPNHRKCQTSLLSTLKLPRTPLGS